MSGNYFSTIEKEEDSLNEYFHRSGVVSEERCRWGNYIRYTPRVHYVSQAAAIGDAERKRDAGSLDHLGSRGVSCRVSVNRGARKNYT